MRALLTLSCCALTFFPRVALSAPIDGTLMGPSAPGASSPSLTTDLLKRLRGGGFVIYFRHGMTDWSQKDLQLSDLSQCESQRNLSAAGRAQMRDIGRALIALRIPIGSVFSSPLCRTRESAELMVGRVETRKELQERAAPDGPMLEQNLPLLNELLHSRPKPLTNTVVVSHQPNFEALTGVSLAQGEAAIIDPSEASDAPAIVARVKSEEWSQVFDYSGSVVTPLRQGADRD